MAAQLWGGLLTSTHLLSPVPGAASAIPARRTPLCSCREGLLHLSSEGFLGPTSLAFATAGGEAMAASVASIARFFAPAHGNLLVILGKWRPPSGNIGRGSVNDGCAGYFWCYRQNKKLGLRSPTR